MTNGQLSFEWGGFWRGKNVNRNLEALPFWRVLTEKQKTLIGQTIKEEHYKKGDNIHIGGSNCIGLMQVVYGSVSAYMLSDEGREIMLYRLEKGQMCVLSASCVIEQHL